MGRRCVAGQSAVQPPAAPPVKVVASEFGSNFVPLGIGKSVVVDVPRDINDVLVADPKIANAVVRTSRRAYLIGAAIGQTSVFFFDADGRQLAGFDIAVTRDLNGMRAALKQMFPEGNVHVEGIAEGVMLSCAVATPVEANRPMTSPRVWWARPAGWSTASPSAAATRSCSRSRSPRFSAR